MSRTFCIVSVALLALGTALRAHPADKPAATDPMSIYYDNTQVCAGGLNADDACHIWLNKDGTFVMFGGMQGGHTGHYKIGPARADGKIPICYYVDTLGIDIPEALAASQSGPGPGGPGGPGAPGGAGAPGGPGVVGAAPDAAAGPTPAGAPAGGPPAGAPTGDAPGGGMPRGPMGCDTVNFKTTCGPGHGHAAVDAQGKPLPLAKGILARFHEGMCYPMRVDKQVGDHWVEADDPSPSQGGLDQLFLLPGHR